MISDDVTPREVRLSEGGRQLEIAWADGASTRFAAAALRAASRSAGAVRASVDGCDPPPSPGLAISRVEPVGSYALRLAFSDGHDRGIFPWAYLRALAA